MTAKKLCFSSWNYHSLEESLRAKIHTTKMSQLSQASAQALLVDDYLSGELKTTELIKRLKVRRSFFFLPNFFFTLSLLLSLL